MTEPEDQITRDRIVETERVIRPYHGFANSRPGHSTPQQSMCQKPLTCDLGKSGATQFPRYTRCDVSLRRSWRGQGSWIASPGPWRVTLYLAHPPLPDLQSGARRGRPASPRIGRATGP